MIVRKLKSKVKKTISSKPPTEKHIARNKLARINFNKNFPKGMGPEARKKK